jgi:hypothetical protein
VAERLSASAVTDTSNATSGAQSVIVLFLGGDDKSIAVVEDWSAALRSIGETPDWIVNTVAVRHDLTPPPELEGRSFSTARHQRFRAESSARVFAGMGITTLPTALVYRQDGLRCFVSGSTSTAWIRKCLEPINGARVPARFEYGQGMSILPPARDPAARRQRQEGR